VFEPLLVYRYFTGKQRELGSQIKEKLFGYMRKKFEEIEIMPCRGCGRSRTRRSTAEYSDRRQPVASEIGTRPKSEPGTEFVKCKFTPPWRGDRRIIGQTIFEQEVGDYVMIRVTRPGRHGYSFNYGYRSPGEVFYVHRKDVELTPGWFEPVSRAAPPVISLPIPATVQPEAPAPIEGASVSWTIEPPPFVFKEPEGFSAEIESESEDASEHALGLQPEQPMPKREFDPQLLPGVTLNVAEQMRAAGIGSLDDVLALGVEGLQEFSGVGKVKAEVILSSTQELKAQMETAMKTAAEAPK